MLSYNNSTAILYLLKNDNFPCSILIRNAPFHLRWITGILLLKLASVLPLVSFRTLPKQSFRNEVSFMHFDIEFRKTFFESWPTFQNKAILRKWNWFNTNISANMQFQEKISAPHPSKEQQTRKTSLYFMCCIINVTSFVD